MIRRLFPILEWLPNYKKDYIKGDLFAGVTVGILLIPQGMAYALIAGLPPIYGLYAALTPQVIYAILGTSRQLAVGPVAMDSLLVATGLGALALSSPEEYILLAIALSFMVGLLQIIMGLLNMGFVVSFLSKPVISGFTSAAAIIIGMTQIKHLLGIPIPMGSQIYEVLQSILMHFSSINLFSLYIGLSALTLMFVLGKFKFKVPGVIIIMVLGILLSKFFSWEEKGIQIVGKVPQGLPNFSIPEISLYNLIELFPFAVTLALIAFMEAISLAKAFQEKHNNYEVQPNQELIALGGANIMGSFFQSYPTTGGFSRTAINDQAGAKSGIASLVSAFVVSLILLFFTPWFYYLPKTILAAVIIRAVVRLIDFQYPKRLFLYHRQEFFVLILTLILTVSLGIKEGILLGVLFSLLHLVYRTSKPHHAILGRVGNTPYFRNINRFPDKVTLREDLLILRFDGQLYFGNIQYFKNLIQYHLENKNGLVKGLILNAESIDYIDATATKQLVIFFGKLKKNGIRILIAGAIGPTRDRIFKSKLIEILKAENLFIDTNDAVDHFDGFLDKSGIKDDIRRQNND